MAAAIITPSVVQKMDQLSTIVSGTAERRLKRAYFEGTKATQNDWFDLSVYGITDTQVVDFSGKVNASGTVTLETFTYATGTGNLILSSAATGTVTVEVLYYE